MYYEATETLYEVVGEPHGENNDLDLVAEYDPIGQARAEPISVEWWRLRRAKAPQLREHIKRSEEALRERAARAYQATCTLSLRRCASASSGN